jgi:hypothetical protein
MSYLGGHGRRETAAYRCGESKQLERNHSLRRRELNCCRVRIAMPARVATGRSVFRYPLSTAGRIWLLHRLPK